MITLLLILNFLPLLWFLFLRIKFIYFTKKDINTNGVMIDKNILNFFHKWNKIDIFLIFLMSIPILNYTRIYKYYKLNKN